MKITIESNKKEETAIATMAFFIFSGIALIFLILAATVLKVWWG